MSRDGLIKSRSSSVRRRGLNQAMGQRGHAGVFFGSRAAMLNKGPLRVTNRPSSYKIAKSFSRKKDILWTNALFEHGMAATGITGAESGTKLYISNLDYGVSNGDIKELFSEVGDLKRCTVHYDRNGHSSGSAEVIYVRRSDAIAAVKRYNNVQLDGQSLVKLLRGPLSKPRGGIVDALLVVEASGAKAQAPSVVTTYVAVDAATIMVATNQVRKWQKI